jgi:hypothetical protein
MMTKSSDAMNEKKQNAMMRYCFRLSLSKSHAAKMMVIIGRPIAGTTFAICSNASHSAGSQKA